MPRRHVHPAGQRLDVERLRELPVHAVADAAQQLEVTQALRVGRCAGQLSAAALIRASEVFMPSTSSRSKLGTPPNSA